MDINHTGYKSAVKDDVVSTRSAVSLTNSIVSTEISTCRHTDLAKDGYCYRHRIMACRTCLVTEHSSCHKEEISETFDNIDKASIDQLLKEIDDVKAKVNGALKDLWNEKTFLHKEKQNVLRHIKEFKIEIQKALEDFEKRTIEKLDSHIKEFQLKSDTELKRAEQKLNEIQEHLKVMKESHEFTRTHYLEFKGSKKVVNEENEKLYKRTIQITNINFIPSAKISNLMKDHENLGDCEFKTARDPNTAYEIKDKTDTSTGVTSADCNITGVCVTNDGTVLLADRSKKIVQRLCSDSLKIKDEIKFSSEPWAVCTTRMGEAAISFPEERRNLKFIGLCGRMKVVKFLKLRHTCRALAFHDHELFVSDQGVYVYIYNLEGHVIRKFSRDGSEGARLSDFRSLAVSNDLLVIADWSEGLLAFDKHGKPAWKYSGADMKRADGVCFDECGNILVCGSQSINILQVSKEGNRIGELATAAAGLVYPTALCFDQSRSVVVVAQQEANVLFYRVI